MFYSRFRFLIIASLGATCVGAAKQVYASCSRSYTPSGDKWDCNWDQREHLEGKAVRHLILIRHGQYNTSATNDKHRILTELGRQQAVLTGERLRQLALPYSLIVRSTMTRAQQTAKIIELYLQGVPIEDCNLLEEGAPIPPEPPVDYWKPEVSELYQDGPRIEAGFRKYFHRADPTQDKDSYEVLVCHGNVIRYFVCRALQFPAEGYLRMALYHASITWISIEPSGRVLLRMINETGHMPPDKITAT